MKRAIAKNPIASAECVAIAPLVRTGASTLRSAAAARRMAMVPRPWKTAKTCGQKTRRRGPCPGPDQDEKSQHPKRDKRAARERGRQDGPRGLCGDLVGCLGRRPTGQVGAQPEGELKERVERKGDDGEGLHYFDRPFDAVGQDQAAGCLWVIQNPAVHTPRKRPPACAEGPVSMQSVCLRGRWTRRWCCPRRASHRLS